MNNKIWLSSPHMGGMEQVYVKDAFETNWVAPLGPHVDGFEKELQCYLGIDHAAALSSGSAAIHLALILLGVEAGDEVICQSFTFSASANPIMYQRAMPIFVDSEPETWNMDPEKLEQAIIDRIRKGKKPKAIIPVHLYGMPAKMREINTVAEKYGIPLLEDAAEALGATYFDKKCGTFGKFGVLSFNGNKIITTSGGGALISNEKSSIQKARFLATQAREPAPYYLHSDVGYNYRMSNICAGIGRGQMEVLDERVGQRRYNYEYYSSAFADISAITFQKGPEVGFFSNRWLTSIIVDPLKSDGVTTEDVRIALEKENIESRPLWKPMHQQPVFQNCPYYGSGISDYLFQNGLCLPSGSNLTQEDLNRVIGIIRKLLK